jgi:hydrogenase maturation factor
MFWIIIAISFGLVCAAVSWVIVHVGSQIEKQHVDDSDNPEDFGY